MISPIYTFSRSPLGFLLMLFMGFMGSCEAPGCPMHTLLAFLWCSCSSYILVHTVDTTRTTWTLEQMVKIRQPVLLVGESGTSKTATTQNFLKNLNDETNVSHYLYLLSIAT